MQAGLGVLGETGGARRAGCGQGCAVCSAGAAGTCPLPHCILSLCSSRLLCRLGRLQAWRQPLPQRQDGARRGSGGGLTSCSKHPGRLTGSGRGSGPGCTPQPAPPQLCPDPVQGAGSLQVQRSRVSVPDHAVKCRGPCAVSPSVLQPPSCPGRTGRSAEGCRVAVSVGSWHFCLEINPARHARTCPVCSPGLI